ncbi:rhamnogalacturonan acetylesterase [Marinoscillum furvescens]|uniref:rhamnogalacturonan acetylesterase n=1 Tax=Marinoscillum furvescens TaxID=1026 RepID=UPI001FE5262E|nr:rhamnogalacturonan acetylesterase [Marinoscillum furvescens]
MLWTKVPEGNYLVNIVTGSGSNLTVKAESRRLMVYDHTTLRSDSDTLTFAVNVRTPVINSEEQISLKERELDYLNWDEYLTLEFAGGCPNIRAITIERATTLPTIFLAGNSTVVDQEREPWASWGQMLPLFLKSDIVVANFAESGETLRSFIAAKRLRKIESLIKPGDFLCMEFAHNDQKPGWTHVEPFTTYQEELMKFVRLARDSQATPVLITSTNRRKFDSEGKIINTLEEYPAAMRELASREGILLIDLNEMSRQLYETLGVEGSKKAFVHYEKGTFPWQDKALADNTHFSTYGAFQLAKCVVQAISASDSPLKTHLAIEESYSPLQPDDYLSWKWPVTSTGSVIKPDGN